MQQSNVKYKPTTRTVLPNRSSQIVRQAREKIERTAKTTAFPESTIGYPSKSEDKTTGPRKFDSVLIQARNDAIAQTIDKNLFQKGLHELQIECNAKKVIQNSLELEHSQKVITTQTPGFVFTKGVRFDHSRQLSFSRPLPKKIEDEFEQKKENEKNSSTLQFEEKNKEIQEKQDKVVADLDKSAQGMSMNDSSAPKGLKGRLVINLKETVNKNINSNDHLMTDLHYANLLEDDGEPINILQIPQPIVQTKPVPKKTKFSYKKSSEIDNSFCRELDKPKPERPDPHSIAKYSNFSKEHLQIKKPEKEVVLKDMIKDLKDTVPQLAHTKSTIVFPHVEIPTDERELAHTTASKVDNSKKRRWSKQYQEYSLPATEARARSCEAVDGIKPRQQEGVYQLSISELQRRGVNTKFNPEKKELPIDLVAHEKMIGYQQESKGSNVNMIEENHNFLVPLAYRKGRQNFSSTYEKSSLRLSNYLLKNNYSIGLFGNARYTNKPPAFYLSEKMAETEEKKEEKKVQVHNTRQETHMIQNGDLSYEIFDRGGIVDLTPLPSKSRKRMKSQTEKSEFYEVERSVVAMRRYEYNSKLVGTRFALIKEMYKQPNPILIAKVIRIQRAWIIFLKRKSYYATIIQKVFHGYIVRKVLKELKFTYLKLNEKFNFLENLLRKKLLGEAWKKIRVYKSDKKTLVPSIRPPRDKSKASDRNNSQFTKKKVTCDLHMLLFLQRAFRGRLILLRQKKKIESSTKVKLKSKHLPIEPSVIKKEIIPDVGKRALVLQDNWKKFKERQGLKNHFRKIADLLLNQIPNANANASKKLSKKPLISAPVTFTKTYKEAHEVPELLPVKARVSEPNLTPTKTYIRLEKKKQSPQEKMLVPASIMTKIIKKIDKTKFIEEKPLDRVKIVPQIVTKEPLRSMSQLVRIVLLQRKFKRLIIHTKKQPQPLVKPLLCQALFTKNIVEAKNSYSNKIQLLQRTLKAHYNARKIKDQLAKNKIMMKPNSKSSTYFTKKIKTPPLWAIVRLQTKFRQILAQKRFALTRQIKTLPKAPPVIMKKAIHTAFAAKCLLSLQSKWRQFISRKKRNDLSESEKNGPVLKPKTVNANSSFITKDNISAVRESCEKIKFIQRYVKKKQMNRKEANGEVGKKPDLIITHVDPLREYMMNKQNLSPCRLTKKVIDTQESKEKIIKLQANLRGSLLKKRQKKAFSFSVPKKNETSSAYSITKTIKSKLGNVLNLVKLQRTWRAKSRRRPPDMPIEKRKVSLDNASYTKLFKPEEFLRKILLIQGSIRNFRQYNYHRSDNTPVVSIDSPSPLPNANVTTSTWKVTSTIHSFTKEVRSNIKEEICKKNHIHAIPPQNFKKDINSNFSLFSIIRLQRKFRALRIKDSMRKKVLVKSISFSSYFTKEVKTEYLKAVVRIQSSIRRFCLRMKSYKTLPKLTWNLMTKNVVPFEEYSKTVAVIQSKNKSKEYRASKVIQNMPIPNVRSEGCQMTKTVKSFESLLKIIRIQRKMKSVLLKKRLNEEKEKAEGEPILPIILPELKKIISKPNNIMCFPCKYTITRKYPNFKKLRLLQAHLKPFVKRMINLKKNLITKDTQPTGIFFATKIVKPNYLDTQARKITRFLRIAMTKKRGYQNWLARAVPRVTISSNANFTKIREVLHLSKVKYIQDYSKGFLTHKKQRALNKVLIPLSKPQIVHMITENEPEMKPMYKGILSKTHGFTKEPKMIPMKSVLSIQRLFRKLKKPVKSMRPVEDIDININLKPVPRVIIKKCECFTKDRYKAKLTSIIFLQKYAKNFLNRITQRKINKVLYPLSKPTIVEVIKEVPEEIKKSKTPMNTPHNFTKTPKCLPIKCILYLQRRFRRWKSRPKVTDDKKTKSKILILPSSDDAMFITKKILPSKPNDCAIKISNALRKVIMFTREMRKRTKMHPTLQNANFTKTSIQMNIDPVYTVQKGIRDFVTKKRIDGNVQRKMNIHSKLYNMFTKLDKGQRMNLLSKYFPIWRNLSKLNKRKDRIMEPYIISKDRKLVPMRAALLIKKNFMKNYMKEMNKKQLRRLIERKSADANKNIKKYYNIWKNRKISPTNSKLEKGKDIVDQFLSKIRSANAKRVVNRLRLAASEFRYSLSDSYDSSMLLHKAKTFNFSASSRQLDLDQPDRHESIRLFYLHYLAPRLVNAFNLRLFLQKKKFIHNFLLKCLEKKPDPSGFLETLTSKILSSNHEFTFNKLKEYDEVKQLRIIAQLYCKEMLNRYWIYFLKKKLEQSHRRLRVIDLLFYVKQKIIKNSQELSFYKVLNLGKIDLSFARESYYYRTLKRQLRLVNLPLKQDTDATDKEVVYRLLGPMFPLNRFRNVYSHKWYHPGEKFRDELALYGTNLFKNQNDPKLIDYIDYILRKENNSPVGFKDIIRERLRRVKNFTNTSIFGLMKYADQLNTDIANKVFCIQCFCKANEKEKCQCSCHMKIDDKTIEESTEIKDPDAKTNDINIVKNEEEEEERKRRMIRLIITKKSSVEDDDEFDILSSLTLQKNPRREKKMDLMIRNMISEKNRKTKLNEETKKKMIDDQERERKLIEEQERKLIEDNERERMMIEEQEREKKRIEDQERERKVTQERLRKILREAEEKEIREGRSEQRQKKTAAVRNTTPTQVTMAQTLLRKSVGIQPKKILLRDVIADETKVFMNKRFTWKDNDYSVRKESKK